MAGLNTPQQPLGLKDHLWRGRWIDNTEAEKLLAELPGITREELARALPARQVVAACHRLSQTLSDAGSALRARLLSHLVDSGTHPEQAAESLAEIATFLGRDGLERKLRVELGDTDPQSLTRTDFRSQIFESWAPVGLLTHITADNDPIIGVFSAVEGLLTSNVNVVKTSGDGSLFTHLILEALGEQDPDGRIAARLIVLRFPSRRTDWLKLICDPADAVAAWGGEAALNGVAEYVPAGCRLITWGHRISIAYLTADAWEEQHVRDGVADSICRLNQQACSSPQVVYLDTADPSQLNAFAKQLGRALDARGSRFPATAPSLRERAEISTTALVARSEEHLGLTTVHESPEHAWRILVDHRSALRASPLYRTVWVKPLPREHLTTVLRPMRRYLQTVGLAALRSDIAGLADKLFAAGALRITPVGSMTDSYPGEPHDGLYPLQRYSRRVSVRLDERFLHDTRLDDLRPQEEPALWKRPDPSTPVMTKPDVQCGNEHIAADKRQLHIRSGGSSGAPALAVYSYADWRTQLRRAGEGLVAAGLDVGADRVANLLFAGDMYGSFLYGNGLLEEIGASQLPITAGQDYARDAATLIQYHANTILAMPSYIWQLYQHAGDQLRSYGGVKKIFYAGEHFGVEQRRHLEEHYGVGVIRSFAYGGSDLGTMAHQCIHAEGSVYHVFSDLFALEILKSDDDAPVAPGETGRLVFTPHTRSAPTIVRYEQGDLGRWVNGTCACSRTTPRFELLGRTGDVVRTGTYFLNYLRFVRIAEEHLDYCGELQLVVEPGAVRERVVLRMNGADSEEAAAMFLAHYPELREGVTEERLLDLHIEDVGPEGFERTRTSGKLRTVIDRRPTR